MKRSERLHEHFSFHVPPPCTPGYLGQQLKCPLPGPKVGDMQCQVGINDSHERNVWEMKALGDHLCADQDVNLPSAEIPEDAPEIVLALERIRIHALDTGVGE